MMKPRECFDLLTTTPFKYELVKTVVQSIQSLPRRKFTPRLQADEAMIKSLTEQVNELTSSDILSRVRDSYSSALAQSNQQHQQELLTLQQQIGELREEVDKKVHVTENSFNVCSVYL